MNSATCLLNGYNVIELSWHLEVCTQPPHIIIGFGPVAVELYSALQQDLSDSAQILFGQDFLALKSKFQDLPWVDGVVYLRACRAQSSLYLPTHLQPNVPVQWLEDYFGSSQTSYDTLYWPITNTVIHAERYWSGAMVKRNHWLDLWYEHYS